MVPEEKFPDGARVRVHDLVGKYGDWLFKQPLLHGLVQAGHLIASDGNPYRTVPTSLAESPRRQSDPTEGDLVFSRADRQVVDAKFLSHATHVIEIQRTTREVEIIKYWRRGKMVRQSHPFQAIHEQERIRLICEHMGIEYVERSIPFTRPTGRRVIFNLNVGENSERRLQFRFAQLDAVIKYLRRHGYQLCIIRPFKDRKVPFEEVYSWFTRTEIVQTRNFNSACRIISSGDYYIGADSGLGHFAVQAGKVVFSIFSSKYHSRRPLFQTTFRNHFTYFGDQSFSAAMIQDLSDLLRTSADPFFTRQMTNFLKNGQGIHPDPYSNNRKVFTLGLAFISQVPEFQKVAAKIHAHSASIFFTDAISYIRMQDVRPKRGRLFIDSEACAQELKRIIAHTPGSHRKSLLAKPCSFFYGTALRDGSSDIDLPTLEVSGDMSDQKRLLAGIKKVLMKYMLSQELPHQTPILSNQPSRLHGLRPIVTRGKLAFTPCTQLQPENLQKYEARIKVKIILGEMTNTEREILTKQWRQTRNGRRLLSEVEALDKDADYFTSWSKLIRTLSAATAELGNFGAKGHILLHMSRVESKWVATALGGLMHHGIIYLTGSRLYTVWNIRRPQHGWFQPITLLTERPEVFRRAVNTALRSKLFHESPYRSLKSLAQGTLPPKEVLKLLESLQPLMYTEAYRYINTHPKKFLNAPIRSRTELRDYARSAESNCNTPADQRLSLWSLATRQPLPIEHNDVSYLTKYNYFSHFLTNEGRIALEATSFFSVRSKIDASAQNFFPAFYQNIVRLLREYFLYSLANGLPPEFTFEKKKEIIFMVCVQGRVLLEGPHPQRQQAEHFLRGLNLQQVLFDGRTLRETLHRMNISVASTPPVFFLTWLLQGDRKLPHVPKIGKARIKKKIAPTGSLELYRSIRQADLF